MEQKKPYKKFNGKGRLTLNPSSLTLNRKRGKLAPLMSEETQRMCNKEMAEVILEMI